MMNIWMQLYLTASLVWFLADTFLFIWEDIDKKKNPDLYPGNELVYNYNCGWAYLSLLTTLPFINVITAEMIIVDSLNKRFKLR